MEKVKVYGYRWVVLSLLMLVTALIEAHWINFAPITNEAAAYYGVSQMQIGLFSLCYMFVFLVMCIPASYILDRFGIRAGIGTGAVLMGLSAAVKGIFPSNYTAVLIAQIGLAVAQPFILNAGTMLAARWFPVNERGTATGFAMLAQYLGIIACMVLTPLLFQSWGMEKMLAAYAVVSVAAAVLFLFL
ncbi:MAG: MFS transporter, partial [Spirochaetota bacterium]